MSSNWGKHTQIIPAGMNAECLLLPCLKTQGSKSSVKVKRQRTSFPETCSDWIAAH
jgi:hypothetical protein